MLTLSRKEQAKEGVSFPQEWAKKIEETLFTLYQDHCEREKQSFELHGFTYPNEVVLTASYLNKKCLNKLPVTYVASVDFQEGKAPQKLMALLVDSIGLFFDSFFANREEAEYLSLWNKASLREQTFYYKVTREMISLTLEANRIMQCSTENPPKNSKI